MIQVSGIMLVSDHEQVIAGKNAEIDRLSKLYRAALEALVEKDSLITELADALYEANDLLLYKYGATRSLSVADLIQKAREVTK